MSCAPRGRTHPGCGKTASGGDAPCYIRPPQRWPPAGAGRTVIDVLSVMRVEARAALIRLGASIWYYTVDALKQKKNM